MKDKLYDIKRQMIKEEGLFKPLIRYYRVVKEVREVTNWDDFDDVLRSTFLYLILPAVFICSPLIGLCQKIAIIRQFDFSEPYWIVRIIDYLSDSILADKKRILKQISKSKTLASEKLRIVEKTINDLSNLVQNGPESLKAVYQEHHDCALIISSNLSNLLYEFENQKNQCEVDTHEVSGIIDRLRELYTGEYCKMVLKDANLASNVLLKSRDSIEKALADLAEKCINAKTKLLAIETETASKSSACFELGWDSDLDLVLASDMIKTKSGS